MEAAAHSDLDLVIVVDDAAGVDTNVCQNCVRSVWEALEPLGIDKPLSSGIFMQAVSVAQLCDPAAIGNLDYPRHVFGLRMQLLLDAQPIYGETNYHALMANILNWYSTGSLQHEQLTPSRYLLNDLIRYYRSYGVWHQFDDTQIPSDSWALRQVKINHSRLLSYTALLALALRADETNSTNRIERWQNNMMSHLHLTPLERLHSLYTQSITASDSTASTFQSLLRHYAHVLEQLADEKIRQTLLTITAATITSLPSADKEVFDHLMLTNSQLRSSLGELLFGSNVFGVQKSDDLYALIL